jgi:hypothetical protein
MTTEIKTSQSAEIKDLVAALAKAQGMMKPAVFNRVNPHFKSRYADFASCMDACRLPLSENGLATIQYCETIDGKLSLVTMLAHTSGQWMRSEFPLITSKMDSQGIGSAITYAKRYSLCGMVGIVADEDGDDDGEASVGREKPKGNQAQPSQNNDAKTPIEKVGNAEVIALTTLISNLDKEGNKSFHDWIKKDFNASSIQDIPKNCFERCMVSINAKIKLMKDQEKTNNTMAVAI